MKDPKFIAGFSAPEVDAAIIRGELDGRANNASSVLRRNPEWFDKGLMNFHAIMEVPKGVKHPNLGPSTRNRELRQNRERQEVAGDVARFRLVGSPYMLPPGTPKERVDILQEAPCAKRSRIPSFTASFLKLVGDEAEPLMPEELAQAISDTPRDVEITELLKAFSGSGPLPSR